MMVETRYKFQSLRPFGRLGTERGITTNGVKESGEMSGKSSFPYRKYDRKPHPHIVKQILDDSELIEMMKEVLIQEGRACPFCHRKLKEEPKATEIW
jgi:hypothetical protein